MAMSSRRLLILLAPAAALAACNTAQTHIGDESAVLGEAVAYDKAIQTVNPNPVYPPNGAKPGDNGQLGAAAVKRYRSGSVKSVEAVSTGGASGGPQ
jgi:predicted small secreted protein